MGETGIFKLILILLSLNSFSFGFIVKSRIVNFLVWESFAKFMFRYIYALTVNYLEKINYWMKLKSLVLFLFLQIF